MALRAHCPEDGVDGTAATEVDLRIRGNLFHDCLHVIQGVGGKARAGGVEVNLARGGTETKVDTTSASTDKSVGHVLVFIF